MMFIYLMYIESGSLTVYNVLYLYRLYYIIRAAPFSAEMYTFPFQPVVFLIYHYYLQLSEKNNKIKQ